MYFKLAINIFAWLAIPVIFFGWATQFNYCSEASCTSLAIFSFVPIGLIILFINSIIKKDYQIALLLLLLIVVSINSFFTLNNRFNEEIEIETETEQVDTI